MRYKDAQIINQKDRFIVKFWVFVIIIVLVGALWVIGYVAQIIYNLF